MVMRYRLLRDVIDYVRPQTIGEIGVHLGHRAELISRRSLEYHREVSYWGYDLWEFLQDHSEVFNGKGASNRREVEEKLQRIQVEHPGYRYTLVQGDHSQTVPQQFQVDMIFIDGDHRIESIQRDLDRVNVSQVKILDDVYWPRLEGLGALDVESRRRQLEDFIVITEDRIRDHATGIHMRVQSLTEGLEQYLKAQGWQTHPRQGAEQWLEAVTNEQGRVS